MNMKHDAAPSKEKFVKMCREAVDKVVQQGYVSVKKIDDLQQCSYYSEKHGKTYQCVIGFMMKKSDACRLDGEGSISNLIDLNLWGFNLNITQQHLLINLQDAHDNEENYDDEGNLLPISDNFKARCELCIEDYINETHEYN